MVKIVLVHPEIPQNTGNIARTCAIVGAGLVLVRPLGFSITEKKLKRAGMDYWDNVDLEIRDDLESVLHERPSYLFSTRGKTLYTDLDYQPDINLVFGSESCGFPTEIYEKYTHLLCTLPMREGQRSLNLSNAAAIALYEWWRQHNFT
jgi:tRNA (cytidine/uridine-2'-O-)-methyltransferase